MAFARSGWGPLGGQAKAGQTPALYVYTTTDAHTAGSGRGAPHQPPSSVTKWIHRPSPNGSDFDELFGL